MRSQTAMAEISWSGSRQDQRALAERHDWGSLQGLEQLWGQLAELYGEATALDAPHAKPPEQLSFNALHRRIEQAAAGFSALGVRPGDVVGLFSENSPRWLVADQALMRLGAADAVRGSSAPVDELRYIAADSQAVALVLESADLLQELKLSSELLGQLRFVVLLQGDRGSVVPVVPCFTWEELMQRGASAPAPAWPEGGEQRLATVLYTSGTTGRPKGVPLTHANLLQQLRHLGVAVAPRPGDRVLSVLPIWHAYERSAEYFLLSCGCEQTYTTLKQLRPDLQRVRPHYLISVPRLWEALLSGFEDALAAMPASRAKLLRSALALSRFHCLARRVAADRTLAPESKRGRALSAAGALISWPLHALAGQLFWPKVRSQLIGGRLRTAISGGGALAMHVDGFFEAIGIELLVGYGLTETSPVLTCRRRWNNRRGSSGQPLPGTAIKIVDPESGAVLGIGERGKVLAKGTQVMGGYLGKPEATAKVLDAQGWFDTGDLGQLLADGTLVLTGRAKDTIVLSSGENIEPGPLEECLVACTLVEQVMLVGQDRKALGALVVPRIEALNAYAQEQGLPPLQGAVADPALLKALTSRLNRRLQARPGSRPDERLAGLALVEPFSIDNGLLTQTLKQKRDRIADRDASAIASIYSR
ncbi:MAG: long-chain fatty acid--CoA ligase [Cyanobacteria bacterium M_surface_10_m1_298]|nr:long-chain fatty acid--CoA ligase [Cyanobacteria bacterium M_surface_10_m1_298]